MAFYSAFQWNAFQWNAYQIARAETITGGGKPSDDISTHIPHYQRYVNEESQREKIKKEKTDLERLESVLREAERKKDLAAESKKLAEQTNKIKRSIELENLEREYLEEINRLLMVRAELIRRIKEEEVLLIILIAMKRRRLRVA